MEILFEIIFDLIIEGSIEISKNIKIPNYIRYPLIIFLSLLFFLLIIGLFIIGLTAIKNNFLIGTLLFIVEIVLLGLCIYKFKKFCDEKRK